MFEWTNDIIKDVLIGKLNGKKLRIIYGKDGRIQRRQICTSERKK